MATAKYKITAHYPEIPEAIITFEEDGRRVSCSVEYGEKKLSLGISITHIAGNVDRTYAKVGVHCVAQDQLGLPRATRKQWRTWTVEKIRS